MRFMYLICSNRIGKLPYPIVLYYFAKNPLLISIGI